MSLVQIADMKVYFSF